MAEEDLLFGKHMHLFGGIEPDNVRFLKTTYTVTNGVPQILLSVELPTDTRINGKHLCTVAGAIICRKEGSYPEDEFDGVVLDTPYTPGMIYYNDTNIQTGKTYFYSVFPYTTQGVYNRNPANRISADAKPGVAPGVMAAFTAALNYYNNTPRIKITYTLPSATLGESGETLNTIAGAVIRRSTVNYPTTETDGEEVTTVTDTTGTFYDENVVRGNTYFYSAFPYTTQGIYNRDNVYQNQSSAEVGDNDNDIYELSLVPLLSNIDTARSLYTDYFDTTSSTWKTKILGAAPMLDEIMLKFKIPEESTKIYIVARTDRFAQSPLDTVDSSNVLVYEYFEILDGNMIADRYGLLFADFAGYKYAVISELNGDWVSPNTSTYWKKIYHAFSLLDDIYITVFPCREVQGSIEYMTGIATPNNTYHYRSADFIIPQPTNIQVKPVASRSDPLIVSCEIESDHYMDDEYEVIFAITNSNSYQYNQDISTNNLWHAHSRAQVLTYRLRDNIQNANIEKTATGYRISMVIRSAERLEIYWNSAVKNGKTYLYVGAFGNSFVSSEVSSYRRFAPMIRDDSLPVFYLDGTAAATAQLQENQLVMMEAMADMYEASAASI